MQCYEGIRKADETLTRLAKVRVQVKEVQVKVKEPALAEALTALDRKMAALAGSPLMRGARPMGGRGEPSLQRLASEQHHLLDVLQGADATPTTQAVTACAETDKTLREVQAKWQEIVTREIPALNDRLRKAELPLLAP
jgi:hypothetical protein